MMSTPNSYVEALTPSIQNLIIFGDSDFRKLKLKLLAWTLVQYFKNVYGKMDSKDKFIFV